MKKTIIIILSAISLFMVGCQKKENCTLDSNVWRIDPTTSQTMNLSLFVDSIYLVPLETRNECLIKRITSINYQNEKFYINNNLTDIQVYDYTGHFLYSTHKYIGRGPNDYMSILSYRLLSNDTIELFDAVAKKLHYYHPTQGLIYSHKLPDNLLPVREYAVINHDTCIFSGGKTSLRFYSKKEQDYIKQIHDKYEGKFIKVSKAFHRIDNQLYLSTTYPSNELFVLDEQLNKQTILKLDFGKYNFHIDEIPQNMNQHQSSNYYSTHNEWVYPYAKYILSNAYIAFFQFKEKMYVAYQNKKTNKTIVFKNIIGKKPQLMQPDFVTNDMLYYGSEPGYLPYLIDTSLMNSREIAKINKIKDDDNPVIIIYKIKKQ